jgi:hypothetical protein
MIDFNIDVASLAGTVACGVYVIGTLRQRIMHAEKSVEKIEEGLQKENALLCDIRERLSAIEICLNCKTNPEC